MPKTLILLLTLLVGCAASQEMHLPESVDLRGIKRVGVLPFAADGGLGADYARALSKSIYARHIDIVPPEHIAHAFGQLNLPEGEPLGLHAMMELGELTRADAFIFGSIDCRRRGRKQATVLMLSARGGETLLRAHLAHRKCGTREGVGLMAEEIAGGVKKAFEKRGLREQVEGGAFLNDL